MKACGYCINSTIVDWDWDEKNKKSIPHYWCEKHHISCDIIYACEDFDTGESEGRYGFSVQALRK